VREGLLALKPKDGEREPMVVVTHSFGSEILYDLLTSGGLNGLIIDLWATVGAQTSLFAEMRLFGAMPGDIPKDTQNYSLGRPSGVTKWVNIYDPADALSYKHQPVFGDVSFRSPEKKDRRSTWRCRPRGLPGRRAARSPFQNRLPD